MPDARTPPTLVVVADDGGVDAARNRGIVAAVRRGIVRAVSVLANGAALDDLVARLRDVDDRERPQIGLHLALTEGDALAGPAAGLTDAAARFTCSKRALWERALAGDVPADAVRAEATAQLARLADAGLVPTRVDGHQHVHVLPGVREGLAAALDAAPAVRWVRLGAPVVASHPRCATFPRLPPTRVGPAWEELHASGQVAQAAFGTLRDEAGVLLTGGRRSAAAFAGLDLLAGPTIRALRRELSAAVQLAPHGITELMTHPGECEGDSVRFSSDAARDQEREALCSAAFTEVLGELGLRLGRFDDAAEAP